MYSEKFQFVFTVDLNNSEKMELLAEMFKLSEVKNIENRSYGECKMNVNGKIIFTSYRADLTNIVVNWLNTKQQEHKLTITKPTYAKNTNA